MRNRFQICLFTLILSATAAGGLCAAELVPAEEQIQEAIDDYVRRKLSEDEVDSASPATDATMVRRLTLDLAGRIPTTTEAQTYVRSNDAEKRTKFVDRLLASPDFAFHQRNEIDMVLLARKQNDGKWREYLLKAAQENRPWDQLFREMMIGREDKPEQQPALAFLKARGKSVDDMANETSRLFFGVNINCAKCHDHPLVEDWKQDHYYGLRSFFERTYMTKKNTLAEKYDGVQKFKTKEGEEKVAKFMFLSGTVVEEPKVDKTKEQQKAEADEVKRQMKDEKAPLPKPPAFSPRAKLVEVALNEGDNRFFARSIVNRVWARLMGRGLVDPLDQMHSENEPSHPELLDWLARDLVAHKFDLKRLIRGIVLSESYARSSRWEGAGDPPAVDYFAVAQPRSLSPRQYALSFLIASSDPDSFPFDPKPDEWKKRRGDLENASDGLAGQMKIPETDFQISVDEALYFSNNGRIEQEYLRDSGDHIVGRLKKIADRKELIETTFWAILSRAPDAEEIKVFERYLSERQDRDVAGIQQIVWALLTSPESRFNY